MFLKLDEACERLIRNDSTLIKLDLRRDNDIKKEGVSRIAEALEVNTTLIYLDLEGNHISDEGVSRIIEALEINSTLTELNLGWNYIRDEGASRIAEALKVNSTLTNLNLYSNEIKDEGSSKIAEALEVNSTLIHLDLGSNCIRDEGASRIAKALKVNSTLTHLSLGWNSIKDKGAIAIIQTLDKNLSLISLNFWTHKALNELTRIMIHNFIEWNFSLTWLFCNSFPKDHMNTCIVCSDRSTQIRGRRCFECFWKQSRLVWLGWYKGRNTVFSSSSPSMMDHESPFSWLPKDMIRIIMSFLAMGHPQGRLKNQISPESSIDFKKEDHKRKRG